MSQLHDNYDEIKRKLRKLKKLEIKIRSNSFDVQKNSKAELVWNKFFDLKDESTEKAKYSIKRLSLMSKDEFKDVINEYLYYVYYRCYKEGGFTVNAIIDEEILTQLGLTIYADDAEVKRKFRELAKIYHPDNGGDSAKFIEVMEKYKNIKS